MSKSKKVGRGRVASYYEPGWYKRQLTGENDLVEKQKRFVFPLDLLPEWALQRIHLFAATRTAHCQTRIINGQFGKNAFNSELQANGTNQFSIKRPQ